MCASPPGVCVEAGCVRRLRRAEAGAVRRCSHLEDGGPPLEVRQAKLDFAVEAPRAQEGGVKGVGLWHTMGGRRHEGGVRFGG